MKPRPKLTPERWQVVIVFLAGEQFNRCMIAAFAAAECFSSVTPLNVACRPSIRNTVSHFSITCANPNPLNGFFSEAPRPTYVMSEGGENMSVAEVSPSPHGTDEPKVGPRHLLALRKKSPRHFCMQRSVKAAIG